MFSPPHPGGLENPSETEGLRFPTLLHQQAAETAYCFFRIQPTVDTVLIVNSVARGQAVPESDLDMAVLVHPETPGEEIARLEALWR
jgi:predicted nucleotidyltransferase